METINLSGTWQCAIPGMEKPIRIPGTLDESGIGYKDVGARNGTRTRIPAGRFIRWTRVSGPVSPVW